MFCLIKIASTIQVVEIGTSRHPSTWHAPQGHANPPKVHPEKVLAFSGDFLGGAGMERFIPHLDRGWSVSRIGPLCKWSSHLHMARIAHGVLRCTLGVGGRACRCMAGSCLEWSAFSHSRHTPFQVPSDCTSEASVVLN